MPKSSKSSAQIFHQNQDFCVIVNNVHNNTPCEKMSLTFGLALDLNILEGNPHSVLHSFVTQFRILSKLHHRLINSLSFQGVLGIGLCTIIGRFKRCYNMSLTQ
jgi:hypothetical protein